MWGCHQALFTPASSGEQICYIRVATCKKIACRQGLILAISGLKIIGLYVFVCLTVQIFESHTYSVFVLVIERHV